MFECTLAQQIWNAITNEFNTVLAEDHQDEQPVILTRNTVLFNYIEIISNIIFPAFFTQWLKITGFYRFFKGQKILVILHSLGTVGYGAYATEVL